jgi:1-deoxy-D-xylulose-5-phosphate synthase
MVVMSPKDEAELRDMLFTAINYKKGPIAIRYPRGSALGVKMDEHFKQIEIGKAEKIYEGKDIAILAVGNMVDYAMKVHKKLADENISAELINMRFIKPLDINLLNDIANRFDKIVTLEENTIIGGFGSAVSEFIVDNNFKNKILRIGLPDDFVDHGTQAELHKILGIDPEGIFNKIKSFI